MTTGEALERFRSFYETFSRDWLARIEELYAPGFVVEDPFHRFDGDFRAMRAYFERILNAFAFSKFTVEDIATGNDGSYVRWRWDWQRKSSDPVRTVPGVTHLRFDATGKIVWHRDLFDAAQGVYEAIPVVGGVLRAIKQRF